MDRTTWDKSLAEKEPPQNFTPLQQAIWYAVKGDWQKSHEIDQDIPGADAAWVHAYLHREEGDEWNAGYWYSRAGRAVPRITLQEELDQIVEELVITEIKK